jgi:histidinol-phosphate phosphatase family protein
VENINVTSKWVILDRDGTICKKLHYLTRPEQIEILPGVIEGLILLKQYGFKFIMITNQSPIGRNIISEGDLFKIHGVLLESLANFGLTIEKIYFCPHLPEDFCKCRKPEIGLFNKAEEEFNLNRSDVYLIGDSISDLEAGLNWGAKVVKIGFEPQSRYEPFSYAKDFYEASSIILSEEKIFLYPIK